MGSRNWFKIFAEKWLVSMHDETPATRSVFVDLLCLNSIGMFSNDGIVKLAENLGMSDEQLAEMIGVSLPLFKQAKARLIERGSITVEGRNLIRIENWKEYQSEYSRQKPYRQAAKEEEQDDSSLKKKHKEISEQDFEDYAKELKPAFSSIDFDAELEKFHLYWSDKKGGLKNPKLALRHWMEKASRDKGKSSGKGRKHTERTLPENYSPDEAID